MVQALPALLPGLTGTVTVFGVPLITAAGSLTIFGQIASVGVSLLVSSAAQSLLAPSQKTVRRKLELPDSLTVVRYVYGPDRAVGTPVVWAVKGKTLVMCWLLNSRASAGPFTLHLDKRVVATTSGDPYDFAGGGALASEEPFEDHLRWWIGRGDQTAPPADILAEVPWAEDFPEGVKATDAFRGCTVLWAMMDAGKRSRMAERWPRVPPRCDVDGLWSLIWDPRDPAQDPDDPATWAYSDNHALVALDAARLNPMTPVPLHLILRDTFEQGAEVSDEVVGLKAGGGERRYRARGTMAFDGSEFESLLSPLMLSAGADWIWVGGRLGMVPGAYSEPIYTVTRQVGPISVSTMRASEGAGIATSLRFSYIAPEREFQTAELPPYEVPGALALNGGVVRERNYDLSWAGSSGQAQRVRKILGERSKMERRLTLTTLGDAFDVVAGSGVTAALPAPFDRYNGTYRCVSAQPALDPVGAQGLAAKMPLVLEQDAPSVYAWTPATDEQNIVHPQWDGARPAVTMPTIPTTATGPEQNLNTGGTVIERIRIRFYPSPTAEVSEWEFQENDGDWLPGGSIGDEPRDIFGRAYDWISPANPLSTYRFRVRSVTSYGTSDWVTSDPVSIGLTLSGVTAAALLGAVEIAGTAPAPNGAGLRVYRAASGAGFGAASPVSGVLPVTPGAAFTVTAGDAGANLLSDPGFDDPGAWTVTAGFTVTGGKAQHTPGAGSSVYQSPAMTAGATYRWGVTVSGRSAGVLLPRIYGATIVTGATLSANGAARGTVTAPASPATFRFVADSAFDGAADDAVFYLPGAGALPQGAADFFVVPVTATGTEGTPAGPFPLTII